MRGMKGMLRVLLSGFEGPTALLAAEQRRLILWVPVGLALGAAFYFCGLTVEPTALWGVGAPLLLAVVAVAAGVIWRQCLPVRCGAGLCAAMALGCLMGWVAAHRQPPMPELPRRGVVLSGVVRAVHDLPPRSAGQSPTRRVDLAAVRFHMPLTEDALPLARFLTVRLRADDMAPLRVGERVALRAVLHPPDFAALPGGRDWQFEAWFSGRAGSGMALSVHRGVSSEADRELPAGGAGGQDDPARSGLEQVGAARRGEEPRGSEPVSVAPADVRDAYGPLWRRKLEALRTAMDTRIRAVLPGAVGAVASVLLDGRGEAIPFSVRDDFAASGLAHLLAVAGLHLGLVMAVVMAVCRLGLAGWEYAALRWPCKALSALAAWGAGGLYVLLTGAHLPALRGWLMAGVVVLGLVAGRRAVSMRGLALAATLLLLLWPQVVADMAFQMSMAAVMALVAGYESVHPAIQGWCARQESRTGRAGGFLLAHLAELALASLLAGVATLPVVMAHLGVIEPYFVLANLVAVPLMAVWIMPVGLLALLGMPFGLAAPGLWLMGLGLRHVLWLAHGVASVPGARFAVPAMPGWGLCLALLGLAWLCLWRRPWRLAGLMLFAVGLLSPWLVTRPDILLSPDGGLIGVRMRDSVLVMGRSAEQAAVEREWARVLALPVRAFSVERNAETPDGSLVCGQDGVAGACVFQRAGRTVLLVPDPPPAGLSRDQGLAQMGDLCAGMDMVVSTGGLGEQCAQVPARLDRVLARQEGAQAVFLTSGRISVVSDREWSGARPWVLNPGGHGRPLLPLARSEGGPPEQ
jgi:competence protein ComEC